MEAFQVFATLSLVDLMSSPLARIRNNMGDLDRSVAGLGTRMGNLALSMAPAALAAGGLLASFGACVSTAAGFEDQMAKVGAVSRASAAELAQLEAKARELGGTTQFTAKQVGEAEQFLAMAGFNVQQNIAALPGVLNLAAATATDLGRAADISSDILGAFGMKAEEMGRVADVLAMTCSTANTNMELLGDTMKYVAPVARTAGLSIEETAAMAGLLGNVGIKGSQAGTTLKAMLNKMAAPAKDAQEVFQKLGITVKDQAGNLRSPIQILGEMAGKLKTMGTAEQMAAMKAVVGEEAVAGFAELIKQGGIGTLEEYIQKIRESGGACDQMAAQMNDTLAGSMRGMGSAWESVQISIGKVFIPVVRKGVDAVTGLLRVFDKFAQSPIGRVILKIAAALASAIVAVTAFAGAMWAVGKVAPMISGVFTAIKAGVLGLGAPVLLLIGACGLLYAAWRSNFGGMADSIKAFWNKITLTVQGVMAVFQNLKEGSGEIRGELATKIKAAGLTGLVQTISRIVYRIRAMFKGFTDAVSASFHKASAWFIPVRMAIADLMKALGGIFGMFGGSEVTSATATWESFGRALGEIAGGVLEGLARAFAGVVEGIRFFASIIGYAIGYVSSLCSGLFRLTGAASAANDSANPTSWGALGKMLGLVLGTVIGVKAAFIAWRGVLLVTSVATKAFAAAQWLLNAAMYANPIGMVIALVVALAAAAGWVIANWDKVKGWWNSFWNWAGNLVGDIWSGIKDMFARVWNAIISGLKNFGSMLLSCFQNAWNALLAVPRMIIGALLGAASSIWNGIINGVSSFGSMLLSVFQGAWNALTGVADGILSGIVSTVSGAWNSIIGGLSGFGSSLLSGVQGVWQSVLNFFSGLNLFDSGAKLLSTFVDGVKNMAGSVVDSVKGVFSKVREYMPFSDAHEGPLSQLTLSGQRMMTTLAEGVAQGKGELAASVSSALGDAGQALDNWRGTVAAPGMDTALPLNDVTSSGFAAQDIVSFQTISTMSIEQPALPDAPELKITAPMLPDVPDIGMNMADVPQIAPIDVKADIPDIPAMAVEMASPEIPGMPPIEFGAIPDLTQNPFTLRNVPENAKIPHPGMEFPPISAMPAPQISAPEVPEPKIPQIAVPEPPSYFPQAADGGSAGRKTSGGNTYTITISNISLPDVQDGESFMNSLMNAIQGGISEIAGAEA